jgi:hypothetical protein
MLSNFEEGRVALPAPSPLPLISLTVDQAVQATNTNRSAIFAAIRNGKLQGRKAGKLLLFEPDELRRWIASLPVRGRQADPASAEACL